MEHSRSKDMPDFIIKEFPDMRLFMSAGLRYSLGRKSYAPGFFLNYLQNNMDCFNVYSLEVFKDDLLDFLKVYSDDKDIVIKETRERAQYILKLIEMRLKNHE